MRLTNGFGTVKVTMLKGEKGDAGENGYFEDLTEEELAELKEDIRGFYKKSEGTYVTSSGATQTIAIPITDYRSTDLLFVDINGLTLVEGTDYTLSGSNIVLTTPITSSGAAVHFIALRVSAIETSDYSALKGDTGEVSYSYLKTRYVRGFETVANMQAATDLVVGMICHTNGFHTSGDGGAAFYIVSNSATANGMDVLSLQNSLYATLVITGSYVTPEMLGAYGDGTTDDYDSMQRALNVCGGSDLALRMKANYLIGTTLTIMYQTKLEGIGRRGTLCKLIAKSGLSTLISVSTPHLEMRSIEMLTEGGVYDDDMNCIVFTGREDANYDADLTLVSISYFNKAVTVAGRNVIMRMCTFSHCRYGVYYDIPSGVSNVRGMRIQNCEFHGIGEELDIDFTDSAGIYCMTNNSKDEMVVIGCTFTQGTSAFYGFVSSLQFEGNYVACFETPCIEISYSTLTNPLNDCLTFKNNHFIGRNGTDANGVSHAYPTNLIKMSNAARCIFQNNSFGPNSCTGSIFKISNGASSIIIDGNFMYEPSNAIIDSSEITSLSQLVFTNNVNLTIQTVDAVDLFSDVSSITTINAVIKGNIKIKNASARMNDYYPRMLIKDDTTDKTYTFEIKPYVSYVFMRDDGATTFEVKRCGTSNQISATTSVSGTKMDFLTFAKVSGTYDTYTVTLNRFTFSTSAVTTLSIGLMQYEII